VGGTVQQATDLTMENTMLPNVGPEAKVVGAHLHFRLIKYLHQSKGNSGVYVVKNVSTVKAPVLKATLLM
jgi:peptidyl-prolyl cis-trans isomerase D